MSIGNKSTPIFLLLLLLLLSNYISAQELNCQVRIQVPKLQTADPQIFKTLESAIFEFMNGRKWTDDEFKEHEKIDCSIILNITNEVSQNEFGGEIIIQSQRPIYNSSLKTPLLNYNDKDLFFEYSEHENLEYNDNTFSSNLTSILAYYAYIIIGHDYESFDEDGGKPFFLKAKNVVDNIPSNLYSRYGGWAPFDENKSRFMLVDNLLNPRYKVYNQIFYNYHRKGLDKMYSDVTQSRQTISASLALMESIYEDNPNAMILRTFFWAKSKELINIYSKAPSMEKSIMIALLSKIDPLNSEEYERIKKL